MFIRLSAILFILQQYCVTTDVAYVHYKVYYDLDREGYSYFLYSQLYSVIGSPVPFGYQLFPYSSHNVSTKRTAHACGVKYFQTPLGFLECVDEEAVSDCTEGFPETERHSYKKCVGSNEGHLILSENGNELKGLSPRAQYSPWVTFNSSKWSPSSTKFYLSNFRHVLCEIYNNWPKGPQPASRINECAQWLKHWKKIHLKRNHMKIDVYYDALCPTSAKFLLNQLLIPSRLIDNENYLDFDLIAYGTTKMVKDVNGTVNFECFKKKKGCKMNKVHACAWKHVQLYSDKVNALRFVVCFQMKNVTKLRQLVACAPPASKENEGIIERISKCAGSKEGMELLAANGRRTEALEPPLKSLPWIVKDGQWSADSMESLMENSTDYICTLFICEERPLFHMNHNLLTGKERDLSPK